MKNSLDRRTFLQSGTGALGLTLFPFAGGSATAQAHWPLPADTRNAGVVKIIGVGGTGANAIERMIASQAQNVELICADTDAEVLQHSSARWIIPLGSRPQTGREATEAAENAIRAAIAGARMLIITAGMGDATITSAAPMIARLARDMGIPTVGLVTKPGSWESRQRQSHADQGLTALNAAADWVMAIPCDRLLDDLGGDLPRSLVFWYAGSVLKTLALSLAHTTPFPEHLHPNAHVPQAIRDNTHQTLIGTASAHAPSGARRARLAAEMALTSPLLKEIEPSSINSLLAVIGTTDGTPDPIEVRNVIATIREFIPPGAHVICTARRDVTSEDALSVTIFAAGAAA